MPWASCHVNLPMKNSAFSTPTRTSVTITDVAAAANVSKSTVSLVLQGSPLVARDTAQRVRQVAESLGYVYNRRAADLRRQVTNVVGIVINDLANPFFAELLVGMQRRLDEAGFVSLMSHTDERLDTQERVLNSMREHNAAGLILCPVFGTPETLLESIRASGMPLVLTVRPQKSRKFDFVGINHEQGTRAATNHLIECGHRRIAFMGRAGAGLVYDKRRRGYERAMQEHGRPIAADWLVDAPLSREGGREGIRHILAMQPRPSAVVCYNDVVAFGAMSELGEHGLLAGHDLAITGFDGVIAAAHSNPPLTTIDTRPGELGALAASALLERLADPGVPPIRRISLPTLVVRQSSGSA